MIRAFTNARKKYTLMQTYVKRTGIHGVRSIFQVFYWRSEYLK